MLLCCVEGTVRLRLRLGFVNLLQDVALHQCLQLSFSMTVTSIQKEITINCLSFNAAMLCERDSSKYSKGESNQPSLLMLLYCVEETVASKARVHQLWLQVFKRREQSTVSLLMLICCIEETITSIQKEI